LGRGFSFFSPDFLRHCFAGFDLMKFARVDAYYPLHRFFFLSLNFFLCFTVFRTDLVGANTFPHFQI